MIPEDSLKIRMETSDGAVIVRNGQAIVSLEGIYIRGIYLSAGARVLIRVSLGKNEIILKGIADAGGSVGGVAIRWEKISSETSRKLASILAAAA